MFSRVNQKQSRNILETQIESYQMTECFTIPQIHSENQHDSNWDNQMRIFGRGSGCTYSLVAIAGQI